MFNWSPPHSSGRKWCNVVPLLISSGECLDCRKRRRTTGRTTTSRRRLDGKTSNNMRTYPTPFFLFTLWWIRLTAHDYRFFFFFFVRLVWSNTGNWPTTFSDQCITKYIEDISPVQVKADLAGEWKSHHCSQLSTWTRRRQAGHDVHRHCAQH